MNAKPTSGPWKRGARVPERHAIRILDRRGFLVAEARGAGGSWIEVKKNAAIIVAAVNAAPLVSVGMEEINLFSSFLIMEPRETFGLELSRWLQSIGALAKIEAK